MAFEGRRIHAVESELRSETERPFEVVQQAPHEIAAYVHAVVEGTSDASENFGDVRDALGVVVGGDAALCQKDR